MQNKLLFVFTAVPLEREPTLNVLKSALQACLFVDDPEFSLKNHLHEWIEDLGSISDKEYDKRKLSHKVAVSIAVDPESPSKEPIGLCIKTRNQFSFFVKPAYRRIGIGSSLLELMRSLYGDRSCMAIEGIKESIAFFRKNHLSHHNYTEKKLSLFPHFRAGKPAID